MAKAHSPFYSYKYKPATTLVPLDMAPHSNSSTQSRTSRPLPPARKINSPVCGPRPTQQPVVYGPSGNQWFHAEAAAKPDRQPMSLQSPPQVAHTPGRVPEHLMARLQGNRLPPELDMSFAQLTGVFPHFVNVASEVAFSLPDHGVMGLPYDYGTGSFHWETQPSHSMPPFDGMGGIQIHMGHMNAAHHPRSYNDTGEPSLAA